MRLEQLVFPHSPARGRSQQARGESGRTAAIDPALRGLVRRTGSSGNGWRYWGYHARRGKTHGRRCRQLKGPELSEKMKLAPQVGFEPTSLRLTVAAPGEHGDDDGPPFGGGVYGGGEHTQADADGAAEEGERDGFGEELDTDVAFGGSEGSA